MLKFSNFIFTTVAAVREGKSARDKVQVADNRARTFARKENDVYVNFNSQMD